MADKTPQEALEKVAGWLIDEGGLSIDESGTVVMDGDPPLELSLTADDQRVVITHVATEPGAGAGRADAVISAFPDRGTTLHAAAAVARSGVTFTMTNHVYVDGLSRQSFMTALNDLVAAVDSIDRNTETGTETETRVQESVTAEAVDIPATEETAQTSVAADGRWAPTHNVPSSGMRAWADPDPSQQPVTRLEAGVELIIAEKRGDWARVVGSNKWTGWVDARQLLTMGSAAAASGSSAINIGGLQLRPLPLIGAAALLLSAFLSWVSFASVNSLEVALAFLWDLNASGSPYLGWAIIAIGVIALALAATPELNAPLLRLTGIVAIAIAGAFLVQMLRGITDSGGSVSDIFDWVGIAPFVSLGAGAVLVAGAKRA